MNIDIITVVPDLLSGPFSHSILKRAADKGLLKVNIHNLRDYTNYNRAQVDDYPFGGGAGMVIMIEPLVNAIEALQKNTTYDEVIFLTPDGETFNQKTFEGSEYPGKYVLFFEKAISAWNIGRLKETIDTLLYIKKTYLLL